MSHQEPLWMARWRVAEEVARSEIARMKRERAVSAIYRYEVPVDDQVHTITCGKPLHVASSAIDRVEFWALFGQEVLVAERTFQVFGTGHELPSSALYRGTTPRNSLGLVWHLFELVREAGT